MNLCFDYQNNYPCPYDMVIVLANKVAYHKITIPVSAYISDEAMFPNITLLWFLIKTHSSYPFFYLNELICIRKSFYVFIMLFYSLGPYAYKDKKSKRRCIA